MVLIGLEFRRILVDLRAAVGRDVFTNRITCVFVANMLHECNEWLRYTLDVTDPPEGGGDTGSAESAGTSATFGDLRSIDRSKIEKSAIDPRPGWEGMRNPIHVAVLNWMGINIVECLGHGDAGAMGSPGGDLSYSITRAARGMDSGNIRPSGTRS